MFRCISNKDRFIIKPKIGDSGHEMLGKFFSKIIESFFIEPDILYHVIQIGIYNFDNLLDIMPTLTPILYLQLYLLVVTLANLF